MKLRADGFTIVELMITVVVASILFAVAIPGFTSLIRNNRLAAQANDFTSTLMFARAEAIKRNARVVVCRTEKADTSDPICGNGTGWKDGWVVFIDNVLPNDQINTGDVVLQMHGELQGGNRLVGNNNVANRIIFLPQGVVGAGGIGGFVLVDERAKLGNEPTKKLDGTRLICMGMTGRSRLAKLTVDDVKDPKDYYENPTLLTCPAGY